MPSQLVQQRVIRSDLCLRRPLDSGRLLQMNNFMEPDSIRKTAPGSVLPRIISDITARDIAWIIVGMLLAYLVTSV